MIGGSGVSWAGGDGSGGGGLSPRATGWGAYSDDEHTSAEPFVVPAATPTMLPNNASSKIEVELPEDIAEFYNAANGRITGSSGSDLLLSIRFTARPTDANGSFVKCALDIGTDQSPIVIEVSKSSLSWGQGQDSELSFIFSPYCGDLFQANGGKLVIECDGPLEVFDINYVIKRTHKRAVP